MLLEREAEALRVGTRQHAKDVRVHVQLARPVPSPPTDDAADQPALRP